MDERDQQFERDDAWTESSVPSVESGGGSEKTSSEKRRSAGDRCVPEERKHHDGNSREEEEGLGNHEMRERRWNRKTLVLLVRSHSPAMMAWTRDPLVPKLFRFRSDPVRIEIPVIATVINRENTLIYILNSWFEFENRRVYWLRVEKNFKKKTILTSALARLRVLWFGFLASVTTTSLTNKLNISMRRK